MIGKFFAYIISLFTIFFVFLLSVSLYIHIATNERVNDICYDIAETISTRGVFSNQAYDYFKSNLSCYGEYEMNIQLEKKNEKGNSEFFYGIDQIKDVKLFTGDRVIISVVSKFPTFFEKISNSDINIAATKVAIVN